MLAFTNTSFLPLEIMACGCPVVSNRGPFVEWLLNDKIAVLCDSDVPSISGALQGILEDGKRRQRVIAAGLKRARATNWKKEVKKIAVVLRQLEKQ